MQIRLNAYTIREVVRQIRPEGADLGFVYAPVDDPAVAIEAVLRTRMVCVLPRAHRLADASAIGPAELVEEQVILLDPINTPGVYLHRRLEEVGVRLNRVVETNLAFAALGLVRSGVGIFVTDPIVLLSGLSEGLVVRPVQPEIPVDLVAIYARQRPLPRLAVRFMAHLLPTVTQLCGQIATAWCEASAG